MLFGEPIRWETSLQLLIDALVTNGLPSVPPKSIPSPHIPILACNMDLQWMAEAVMPRFGHGAFLLCLENLYKKVTNQELVYTALVGKPSEITYRHGEHVLQEHAKLIYGSQLKSPLKTMYFVGDNICTDIFGANLYHKYLARHKEEILLKSNNSRSIDHLLDVELNEGAESCYSVLVETGVYSGKKDHNMTLNHSPRDFLPVEETYQTPTMIAPHVLKAVEAIFRRENFA